MEMENAQIQPIAPLGFDLEGFHFREDKKVATDRKTGARFSYKRFKRGTDVDKIEIYVSMTETPSKYVLNITQLLYSEKHIYMLHEYHYENLHDFVATRRRLKEPQVRSLFKQCVSAVYYAHENDIVIRNLSLKSFVFTDLFKTKIVLANFSQGVCLDNRNNDWVYGFPDKFINSFASPEMLKGDLYSGKMSDVWCLGVILFTLVTKKYPFRGSTIYSAYTRISKRSFCIPRYVSTPLTDLIDRILILKPSKRLNLLDILNHQWFFI